MRSGDQRISASRRTVLWGLAGRSRRFGAVPAPGWSCRRGTLQPALEGALGGSAVSAAPPVSPLSARRERESPLNRGRLGSLLWNRGGPLSFRFASKSMRHILTRNRSWSQREKHLAARLWMAATTLGFFLRDRSPVQAFAGHKPAPPSRPISSCNSSSGSGGFVAFQYARAISPGASGWSYVIHVKHHAALAFAALVNQATGKRARSPSPS